MSDQEQERRRREIKALAIKRLASMGPADDLPQERPPGAKPIYSLQYAATAEFRGEWVNKPDPPLSGGQGFPVNMETPAIRFAKGRGIPKSDVYLVGVWIWLVSKRAKVIFESVDPSAFSFRACKTSFGRDQSAPTYWLCDVVRILDALDPAKSGLKVGVSETGERRTMSVHAGMQSQAVFREETVNGHHVFRLSTEVGGVFCDAVMRASLDQVKPKFTGITLKDWGYTQ